MSINGNSVRLLCSVVACAATLALLSTPGWAGGRPDDDSQNWFAEFGGGYAFPQSDANDVLDDDWMLTGGATYWPSDRNVGLNFGLTYAEFDLTDDAVAAVNDAIAQDPFNSGRIDGGEVETWQLTVNAIWGPGRESNGFYLSGGIGAYYLKGTVTETGLFYYPPFCDPWYWWWCYPGGVGVGSVPTGSDSTTEYGYNLGLGYSFPAGDGQLFLEAKYHFINTDSEDMTFVPVTLGYRW